MIEVHGYHVAVIESALSSRARLRITSGPRGAWVRATWICGCRAEGLRTHDLLLTERCHEHRSVLGNEHPGPR